MFSTSIRLIDEGLRDVGQPLQLFSGLVPIFGNKSLHLADRNRQIRQRRIEIGSAVVDDAAQSCQPVFELHDLLIAVPERGDEVL